MKLAIAGASSNRVPTKPRRTCGKNNDKQNIVAHGSHDVSVEERMEPTSHSTTGAIEPSHRLEGTGGEHLRFVRVDDADDDTSSKRDSAGDGHPGVDASSARRARIEWRTCLIRRIDGVRQHAPECRADLVMNCCRCLW